MSFCSNNNLGFSRSCEHFHIQEKKNEIVVKIAFIVYFKQRESQSGRFKFLCQAFVNDYEDRFDCLDTTDETEVGKIVIVELCMIFPTFECEEVTYGYHDYFVCGDG